MHFFLEAHDIFCSGCHPTNGMEVLWVGGNLGSESLRRRDKEKRVVCEKQVPSNLSPLQRFSCYSSQGGLTPTGSRTSAVFFVSHTVPTYSVDCTTPVKKGVSPPRESVFCVFPHIFSSPGLFSTLPRNKFTRKCSNASTRRRRAPANKTWRLRASLPGRARVAESGVSRVATNGTKATPPLTSFVCPSTLLFPGVLLSLSQTLSHDQVTEEPRRSTR